MDTMKYFYELFEKLNRGGPGDNDSTRTAFEHMKDLPPEPFVLDIGCGPGMQTLELARISKSRIIALDNHQPFLDILMENAKKEDLADQITIKNQSMMEMDFEENTFDIIWSEGALYIMGFENGLKRSKQLLKQNGYMAVTDAVYLQADIPEELSEIWNNEYPDIKDIEGNIKLIKGTGLELISHFTLPKSSWIDNFYIPMEKVLSEMKQKYEGNETASGVFEEFESEIQLYKDYSDYYGYEFFVMKK